MGVDLVRLVVVEDHVAVLDIDRLTREGGCRVVDLRHALARGHRELVLARDGGIDVVCNALD